MEKEYLTFESTSTNGCTVKKTYANETGEVTLMNFFDMVAIHELSHAFMNTVGINTQRNWLNELFANPMPHT